MGRLMGLPARALSSHYPNQLLAQSLELVMDFVGSDHLPPGSPWLLLFHLSQPSDPHFYRHRFVPPDVQAGISPGPEDSAGR